MIRALRRRLALIFGLLTSLVLTVMLAITCYLARSQYQLSQEVLYQSQFQSLTRQLQASSSVSDSWLGQISQDQDAFFYVELEGAALHYASISIQDPERAELLDALREQSTALGFNPAGSAILDFTFPLSGTDYRATAYSVSGYLIFYCQDLTRQQLHLHNLILTYVLLGAAGVAALVTISWLLSRLATQPTAAALREQQEFVAAASHELRSPLTVIRASLYAATQKSSQPEVVRQLELSDREAERMARLIQDLLTLASSGTGRWSVELRPVELETVCSQLYEQFQPRAEASGHRFRLILPEDPLPVVSSDAHRLVQLLSVLLSNALDHTLAGTEVALAARVSGQTVTLSVVDHGPGIPLEERKAVFRRFYRADQSRTDKQHFGLGLPIARELSTLLGGRLTLQETPGGGATFSLQLSSRRRK